MVQKTIKNPDKQVSVGTERQSQIERAKADTSKRAKVMQIRFNYYEYEQVKQRANAQHLSIASYIRRAALLQRMPRQ